MKLQNDGMATAEKCDIPLRSTDSNPDLVKKWRSQYEGAKRRS
jgi:hypothetical protein